MSGSTGTWTSPLSNTCLCRQIKGLKQKGKTQEGRDIGAKLVAATTKGTGEQTIRSRKDELKEHFFGIGNYHATKDTLDAFLRDQEVKQLLPAGFSVLSKQDQIDAKATKMLLAAGKEFFTKLLVSNGRKSDVDRAKKGGRPVSWAKGVCAVQCKAHPNTSQCQVRSVWMVVGVILCLGLLQ